MNIQQEVFKKYEQKISEYEQHLVHLNSTKDDYKELIDTLTTLPNTLQPKIMVPLGKLAFFEGNLKSTNEILILLGDNYFAKRSSKQTIDIIQRRDKDIDNNIIELKEQINGLKQRITLTTDISKAMNEKEYDNIIEIKEEYDEEKEKEFEKKRNQPTTSSSTTTTTTTTTTTPVVVDKKKKEEMDQEFEKMLKRLSILEEKEKKMGDDYDEDDFNKKFNKKLGITSYDDEDNEDEQNEDDEDEYNYGDEEEDDDNNRYYDNDGEYDENDIDYTDNNNKSNISKKQHKLKSTSKSDKEFTGNDEYYEPAEEEEIVEYYDEFGNVVDINDPNVEYIQDGDEAEEHDDEALASGDDGEFNMDSNKLSEKEIKEIKEFKDQYNSNQKKRISYIDTPQPPTPESHTTIKPKSILKTNSSNNLTKPIQPYDENDENDVRRYIKNLGKQDMFENNKTISVPNPPKDIAFSGDIVEKQTDLFPFDEIPKPTPPSNSKQSRFKSSRLNK